MTEDQEQQLDQIIADFLQAQEDGLTVSEADVIAAHPELADALREFFDDLGQMDKLASPLAAPAMLRRPVLGKLRYFGDYELLEEIARGGMGIVYKARQTSLNRIVAVKLILSGHLASETDVRRFQTEAESAANLQHPHIVSVHEVGRHEGQSYFSMEYIEGKNLSEIVRDHPLPPKQAAGYVREVAEAIHYAHQQGTLHRDLKPSNVLIDQNDRVQITDFGLAMKVEGDSELTRTGQVLGTPSYMPPEQAQHKRGLIGPASDIYSIGAVLYELITGRPPFQAESAVETLRQVIETGPPSPRLLNPAVPKDLETICLKCLQKEPHKRYATAQHLADDLGRFLQGEPILARPIGRVERTWRWCQRNPAFAGLSAALVLTLIVAFAGITTQWFRAERAVDDLTTEQLRRSALEGSVADLETREASLNESLESVQTRLSSEQARVVELQATNADLETREHTLNQSLDSVEKKLSSEQNRVGELQSTNEELETRSRELKQSLENDQRQLALTHTRLARTELKLGNLVEAKRYLEDCSEEHRTWEWYRTNKLCHPLLAEGDHPELSGTHLSFDDQTIRLAQRTDDAAQEFGLIKNTEDLSVTLVTPSDERHRVRLAQEFDGFAVDSITFACTGLSPDHSRIAISATVKFRIKRGEYQRFGLDKITRSLVIVADTSSGEVTAQMPLKGQIVHSLCFTSDNNRLAVATSEGDKDIRQIPGRGIRTGNFPRDRTWTETQPNYQIAIWNLREQRVERRLPSQNEPFGEIRFGAEGRYLVELKTPHFRIWDVAPAWQPLKLASQHFPVYAIAWSPDGRYLVTANGRTGPSTASYDADKSIIVWDVKTGREAFRLSDHEQGCYRLEFSQDGDYLSAACISNVKVWNFNTREIVFQLNEKTDSATFSPDGVLLATGSNTTGTRLWRLSDGGQVASFTEGGYGLVFSPDGKTLYSATSKQVVAWDLETKTQRFETGFHHHRLFRIAFRPGVHSQIAVSTPDDVHVFDANTGEYLKRWTTGSGDFTVDLAYNPQGTLIATTNIGAIRLWDADTGRELNSLRDPRIDGSGGYHRAYAVAFSRDGRRLAAGWGRDVNDNSSGNIFIWDTFQGTESLAYKWLGREPIDETIVSLIAEKPKLHPPARVKSELTPLRAPRPE